MQSRGASHLVHCWLSEGTRMPARTETRCPKGERGHPTPPGSGCGPLDLKARSSDRSLILALTFLPEPVLGSFDPATAGQRGAPQVWKTSAYRRSPCPGPLSAPGQTAMACLSRLTTARVGQRSTMD